MNLLRKYGKIKRSFGASSRGAALLELVLVLAVLVVLLVALVSLSVLSLSTVQKSRLRARATGISEAGLENVRQSYIAYANNDDWAGFLADCSSQPEVTSWAGSYDDDSGTFIRSESCSELSPTRVQVDINTRWSFSGVSYDVNLTTEFRERVGGIFR